jgi:hypothetical protein
LVQRTPDPPSVAASLRIHQPVPINASISRSNTSTRMTVDTADLIRATIPLGARRSRCRFLGSAL